MISRTVWPAFLVLFSACVHEVPKPAMLSIEESMQIIASRKFPPQPVFGDLNFDDPSKPVTFLNRTWTLDDEPPKNTTIGRFGMIHGSYSTEGEPDWRLVVALPINEEREPQYKLIWLTERNINGKWEERGLKKSYFRDGDIWEIFNRTDVSYIQNTWDENGKKEFEQDNDSKVIGPRRTPPEGLEAAQKRLENLVEAKTPIEFALVTWDQVIETTNQFHHVAAFEPPVDITWTLPDSPFDWSQCVVVRDKKTTGSDPETALIQLSTELFGLRWRPIIDAQDREGWARWEFKTGEDELLEWKFRDESDDKKQFYRFEFRLKQPD